MSDLERDYVWKHSPYKGTAKLIHLAMADLANEAHQWRVWAGDAYLARMAGCDERTVRRAKVKMLEDGMITEAGFDVPTGNRQYRFVCPGVNDSGTPDILTGEADEDGATGHLIPVDRTSAPPAPITNRTEPHARAARAGDDTDPMVGFELFWQHYPRRNGRRIGRALCEKRWRKLSLADKRAAYRGALNYERDCDRGLTIAKDPDRWLRDRLWEDWQDEAADTGEPSTWHETRSHREIFGPVGA